MLEFQTNIQVRNFLLGDYKVKQMTGQIAKLGLAASAVSIVASVYIYFMHDGGDTTLGIFVGLWAPTLILFSQEIEKMMD